MGWCFGVSFALGWVVKCVRGGELDHSIEFFSPLLLIFMLFWFCVFTLYLFSACFNFPFLVLVFFLIIISFLLSLLLYGFVLGCFIIVIFLLRAVLFFSGIWGAMMLPDFVSACCVLNIYYLCHMFNVSFHYC